MFEVLNFSPPFETKQCGCLAMIASHGKQKVVTWSNTYLKIEQMSPKLSLGLCYIYMDLLYTC